MNNITVRNIPDRIHKKLKIRAELTHRSLNNEIIACLEESLFPNTIEVKQILDESDRIRRGLNFSINLEDIISAKNTGRE